MSPNKTMGSEKPTWAARHLAHPIPAAHSGDSPPLPPPDVPLLTPGAAPSTLPSRASFLALTGFLKTFFFLIFIVSMVLAKCKEYQLSGPQIP